MNFFWRFLAIFFVDLQGGNIFCLKSGGEFEKKIWEIFGSSSPNLLFAGL